MNLLNPPPPPEQTSLVRHCPQQQTNKTGARNCTKTVDKPRRFVDKTKKHVKLLSTRARQNPYIFTSASFDRWDPQTMAGRSQVTHRMGLRGRQPTHGGSQSSAGKEIYSAKHDTYIVINT